MIAAHLAEVLLEDYARQGRIPSQDSTVRLHLTSCVTCRARLADIEEFLTFVHADPEETAGHIFRRHVTGSGAVFLVVSGSDAAHWEGRLIGGDHDLVRVFARGDCAKEHVEQQFEELFPSHRCGPECGPGWR